MSNNKQEMKEEFPTWRDLLGKVASKPSERHRIASALHVNSVTITRWIAGTTKPRIESLRILPQAVPYYKDQLILLLKQEYPDMFSDEADLTTPYEIPTSLYSRVLNIYAMNPEPLRAPLLSNIILENIAQQFDPVNGNFVIFIAQCVPPEPDHKVRSMRVTMGYEGPSTARHFVNQTYFCGSESLAGLAAFSAHPIITQKPVDVQRIIPGQQSVSPGSSITIPLLQYDHIAACICFASPQENYFTAQRIALLNNYVNLLTIVFNPQEFYPLSDIDLAMMPPRSRQEPILSKFQNRILARMLHCSAENHLIFRSQAEKEVVKEMEQELIQLVFAPHDRSEASIYS